MTFEQYISAIKSSQSLDKIREILQHNDCYLNKSINDVIKRAMDVNSKAIIEEHLEFIRFLAINKIYNRIESLSDETFYKYINDSISKMNIDRLDDMEENQLMRNSVPLVSMFIAADDDNLKYLAVSNILRALVLTIYNTFINEDVDRERILLHCRANALAIMNGSTDRDTFINCNSANDRSAEEKTVLIQMYYYLANIRHNMDLLSNIVNHDNANIVQEAIHEISSKYDKYFGDASEYVFRSALITLESFFDECKDFDINNPNVKKAYENFKANVHYNLILDMDKYALESANNTKMPVYKSIIYKALSFYDTKYNPMVESFIDSYFPSAAYEGLSYDEYTSAMEADGGLKDSLATKTKEAKKKTYAAYKKYKDKEEAVDNQLTKMINFCKNKFMGDTRTEIIEGKEFSAIGLLKKALGTAAIFSWNKIGGLIFIVVRYACRKNTSTQEKKKICLELELEIKMLEEKIQDAASDGDREAKYAMMRTKAQLENALKKIEYGIAADERSVSAAKNAIKSLKGR